MLQFVCVCVGGGGGDEGELNFHSYSRAVVPLVHDHFLA